MLTNKKGFTLFELAVVLAGLSLAATAAIPYFIRQAEVTAAQRTAREVSTIQEASKWYYRNNANWPGSIGTLKSAGYLGPSWSARNPWGTRYATQSNATSFTVVTSLPHSVGGVLLKALPNTTSSTTGGTLNVRSAVSRPGHERKLREVRAIVEEALALAEESAVPPHGPTFVSGSKIDGRNKCPPGHAVIHTWAGGGENNTAFRCQSMVRAGSRFAMLIRQLSQLEFRNMQLANQNRLLKDRIERMEDYFEDDDHHRWYRYWREEVR